MNKLYTFSQYLIFWLSYFNDSSIEIVNTGKIANKTSWLAVLNNSIRS
jgi:hypothetical protein